MSIYSVNSYVVQCNMLNAIIKVKSLGDRPKTNKQKGTFTLPLGYRVPSEVSIRVKTTEWVPIFDREIKEEYLKASTAT